MIRTRITTAALAAISSFALVAGTARAAEPAPQELTTVNQWVKKAPRKLVRLCIDLPRLAGSQAVGPECKTSAEWRNQGIDPQNLSK